MTKNKKLTLICTIASAIFGLVLTFFILKTILNSQYLSFTFSNIILIHKNTSLYFVDFLTIIMAIATYIIVRKFESKKIEQTKEILSFRKRTMRWQMFSESLLNDNFDAVLDDRVENNDKMETTLLSLRDKIKNNKLEEEVRKKKDREQNWVVEGIAKFGEILRKNNNDLQKLASEIISNMCQYTKTLQGGIFILDDSDPKNAHFDMIAHFAYNRQKYSKKRVELKEGLIGRAAAEQRIIVLDNAPEDYLEITSGLGEANPNYILIAPLCYNEEVHGVVEVSGFNPFYEYQIAFFKEVSESIGTTFRNVKINLKTVQLLEESKEQSERLSQQEEEMRQNMEELQATQEEAAKQAEHFISFTNSVNHTMIRAEYDIKGNLIYANSKFLLKFEYYNSYEVEGYHISMFLDDKDRESFNEIWSNLVRGGKYHEGYMKYITKKGHDLWTMATYTPVKNAMGEVDQILFLAIDTTEQQERSIDYEQQMKALNIANIKANFLVSGKMSDYNEKFISILGYSRNEILNMTFFDMFKEQEQEEIEKIWKDVINSIPFEGQIKITANFGKELWMQTTLVAKNDMYGEVDKIILIANDITDQKELEIQIQRQNKKLLTQEEKLKNSELELNKRLEKARKELREHFAEMEGIKIRNELTLEGALDSIVTFNQKGVVEFFNKAAENLWNINKKLIIGRNIRILFNEETIQNNDFVNRMVSSEKDKIVGERMEINITTKDGENKAVLCLLSDAVVNNNHTYTAFIQNIELELF